MENIRNFVIIAHIDHGKSTLADRLLEITGTIDKRKMKSQFLDQLDLERERGITIKMAPVRMLYNVNGKDFVLNLIDTPGHPDFAYEVSRALAAVEGAVILVDGTQGIQAQTLSTFYEAKNAGLTIIGAVNKIDIKSSLIQKSVSELSKLLNVDESEIHKISAKTGEGVRNLLDDIVRKIPCSSKKDKDLNLSRAMVFDSFYDGHKGIIASVRVFEGNFKEGDEIEFLAVKYKATIKETGFFIPLLSRTNIIKEGEIGYFITGLKDAGRIKIGDTIILRRKSNLRNDLYNDVDIKKLILPGYKEPNPVVFVSLFPENPDEFDLFKKSLERLRLNDSSLIFEPDSHEVLGRGFKGGFLGTLHFEITTQRLKKEFGINVITTFPSVAYKIKTTNKDEKLKKYKVDENGYIIITDPKDIPDSFDEILEPMIQVEIICYMEHLGKIMEIGEMFRWEKPITNMLDERVLIKVRMPLSELIADFDDVLKSVSSGFASYSYKEDGYKKSELVRMDVLVSGNIVPGLSQVVSKNRIIKESRKIAIRLKSILPKQLFSQAIQIVSNGRIIARETIPALKKNVTAHLYGGDRTRKMKLWKKQKKGKKKLKELGYGNRVVISPNDFKKLLSKQE